jgi:hypothetical protein
VEEQLAHLAQQHDLTALLLSLVVLLHILELAAIGFVAAWSVHIVSDNQKRMEREWSQVLQILAHARAEERRRGPDG